MQLDNWCTEVLWMETKMTVCNTALACNPFEVRAVPDVPVKGKF